MALTEAQHAQLSAMAMDTGVPIESLVAIAEEEAALGNEDGAFAGERPKLFQYHLPFLRVREVRAKWLGLDERVEGDEMLCGKFLERYGGALVKSPSATATATDGEAPPEK